MKKQKDNKLIDNLKLLRKILIIILILILLSSFLIWFKTYFNSSEQIANFIQNLGIFGPLFLILIVTIEVLIAPIPGALISIASGYAFGGFLGSFYNYIGNIIGNSLAFLLAHKYGRPFVERIINKKKLNLYDCFFRTKGKYLLWIGFLFPIFPTDLLSFTAGLSKIKFKSFLIILSIAFIPNMIILNYFGSTLFYFGFSFETLYFSLVLFILFLIALIIFIKFIQENSGKCKNL